MAGHAGKGPWAYLHKGQGWRLGGLSRYQCLMFINILSSSLELIDMLLKLESLPKKYQFTNGKQAGAELGQAQP